MAVLLRALSSPACGVISHPVWAGEDPRLVTNARLRYKFIFIQCQTGATKAEAASRIPLACGSQVSEPFTPLQDTFSPLCLLCCQQLPGARGEGGDGCTGQSSPGLTPSCSRLDIAACGLEADRLVARFVILLAVVHPRHHCQDEGLWDQQLHVHLWKRRRVI